MGIGVPPGFALTGEDGPAPAGGFVAGGFVAGAPTTPPTGAAGAEDGTAEIAGVGTSGAALAVAGASTGTDGAAGTGGSAGVETGGGGAIAVDVGTWIGPPAPTNVPSGAFGALKRSTRNVVADATSAITAKSTIQMCELEDGAALAGASG